MYPNSHNQIGASADASPATAPASPVAAKIMKIHGQLDLLNAFIDKAIDASMPGLCGDPRQMPKSEKGEVGPPSTCPLECDLEALSRRMDDSSALIASLASSIRL